MYIPAQFCVTDPDSLHRIIQEHPLGILVTATASGMDANHIPFEFDPARGELGLLSGHVARANPLWQQCLEGADVLVVFRASEGYISPNWYPPASMKPIDWCRPGTTRSCTRTAD